MKSATEQSYRSSPALRKRLIRLIVGRCLLGLSLLAATWFWRTTFIREGTDPLVFRNSLFALFSVVVVLTVAYALWQRVNRNYLLQVKFQVWVDLLLTWWLVWQTRGYLSPYTTLFIIVTSVAGYFFNRRETLFFGIGSAAAFVLVSVLNEWNTLFSDSPERGQAAQTIAFTIAGILAVALLAARLAEKRRIGEQLEEATESFADMRVLHERIVESIASGLITTDLEGTIRSFNRAAEEISGMTSKEAVGKRVEEILGTAARSNLDFTLGPADGGDAEPVHFEASIENHEDGDRESRVSVACTVSPLVGRNGLVSGTIIAFQDLTRIRSMEEDLRRSDRLAAVGRMAAGLAHEIRNPLGSMSAALQFLKEKDTTSNEDAELLEVALRESERLEQIISNFLSYARPSSPTFTKDGLGDTNMNQSLQDCLTLLEHSPEKKPLHMLEFDIPDEPIVITANPSQIKQVFWNLARNSIQAMPSGGTLRVGLSRSGRNVKIIFEDTGKGIDPEYLEHVFEPFSDRASGTGLGLSIVHRIVTDHGGRIEIESILNEGTKVTVELPQQ